MSISIKNVTKTYGKQIALNEVSFDLKKGEILGFLGPNGAGKSTLMKIVVGMLPCDSGEVYVTGELVNNASTKIRQNIGYLPENNPLYTDMYIREYLNFVADSYKIEHKSARIEEVIKLVGLSEESHKKIHQLSKGYKQRVGIAQALIHNPEVLVLDEPTTGLDPNQLEEIRGLIRMISQDKTVILSSHIMQEIEAVCSRVIILHQGEIVKDEAIQSITQHTKQTVNIEFTSSINQTLIEEIPYISSVKSLHESSFIVTSDEEEDICPKLFQFAVEQKLTLKTLVHKTELLEDVFQSLTKSSS